MNLSLKYDTTGSHWRRGATGGRAAMTAKERVGKSDQHQEGCRRHQTEAVARSG